MLDLFPIGHEFASLKRAGFDPLRRTIADPPHRPGLADVATIWATADLVDDPRRRAVRPVAGEFEGTATSGNLEMPSVGLWLGSRANVVYLLERGDATTDPALVRWFRDADICGATQAVTDLQDLRSHLERRGTWLYGCDEYGPLLDGRCLVPGEDFHLVSSKGWAARLVGPEYAPYEEQVDVFEGLGAADFLRIRGDSDKVYIKCDNAEHGGVGVRAAANPEEFARAIEAVRRLTRTYDLNPRLAIQRGVSGVPCSFAVFLTPGSDDIAVVAVTEQVVCPRTARDLGNKLVPITRDAVEPIAGLIRSLVANVRAYCRNPPLGFLMCDYIRTEAGQVFGIDPGLRVSASTPAAMFQAWVRSRAGEECFVSSETFVEFRPGFDFDELRSLLGDFADPEAIIRHGVGAIPFSWQRNGGWGRMLIMAPSEREYPAVLARLQRRMPVRGRLSS
jgi:hypothetical protein